MRLDIEEIKKLYSDGLSCTKIAKKFGCCMTTISNLLKQNGVEVIIQPRKLYLNNEDIIKRFKNGETLTNIAKSYDVSRKPIRRILRENNIEVINLYNQKYSQNNKYFKVINTEEKAYWLGFLFADGNVQLKGEPNNKSCVEIGLSEVDKGHLNKFKLAINSNYEIKEKLVRSNDKIYRCCRICVYSKEMAKDLYNLGCLPNKSLILKFPNINKIPYHLLRHFIRGYVDGDGSIYSSNNTINLNILGTDDFITSLQKYFYKNIQGYTLIKNYSKSSNSKIKFILKSHKQAMNILDFLYDGATIYLDRKYEKYISLKEKYYNCRLEPRLQKAQDN